MHGFMKNRKIGWRQLPANRYIDFCVLLFLVIFPAVPEYILDLCHERNYGLYDICPVADLLWGYTGLMSMGHSVLFGAGGYMIGIASAYANQADWIKFDELPWFLAPLQSEAGAFLMAILVPGADLPVYRIFHVLGEDQGRVFFSDYAGPVRRGGAVRH